MNTWLAVVRSFLLIVVGYLLGAANWDLTIAAMLLGLVVLPFVRLFEIDAEHDRANEERMKAFLSRCPRCDTVGWPPRHPGSNNLHLSLDRETGLVMASFNGGPTRPATHVDAERWGFDLDAVTARLSQVSR